MKWVLQILWILGCGVLAAYLVALTGAQASSGIAGFGMFVGLVTSRWIVGGHRKGES